MGTTMLGVPAHGLRAEARASLAAGRHAEALEALKRARRASPRIDPALHALQEAEALFGLLRFKEALGVITRALHRRPGDGDLATRLRIARGHALWLAGRPSAARAEVLKAAAAAAQPLTRARALELLGLFDWHRQEENAARAHLATARALYQDAGSREGVLRVLEKEAALLRDAGRWEEALGVHERRIEAAAGTTRTDLLALARNDRGDLLATLGRWGEAREELGRAAELFRSSSDPRVVTVVGVNRAALDLAAGDLEGARVALERARQLLGEDRGDPRSVGEVQLLFADLRLASGEPGAAEAAAVLALSAFEMARDAAGVCRARVRRCHALLGLGRSEEGVREARRALRGARRRDLEALAGLTLGRLLLRTRPVEAAAVLERVLSGCDDGHGLALAARLGRCLARGAGPDHEEVRLSIAGLEMWGDRRLLSVCRADVRELAGVSGSVRSPALAGSGEPVAASSAGEPVLDAALALVGDEEWPAGWAAALRAVRGRLQWWRAALISPEVGWELRGDDGEASALPASDVAREIAASVQSPALVDLRRDERWRVHPARVLHGLDSALVAPVAPGAVLYLDRREGQPPLGEGELGLATQVARLLARRLPEALTLPDAATARFPEIVGRCAALEGLFATMAAVAPSRIPVHIYGETGTGKEKVAAALHDRSPRRGRPFVAVNASSISDELFESEMFGHVRGAFTGAVIPREGHVAAAEGGTLFLDEVADLTPRAQAKLLRFLEQGEYRRLGESATRRAVVRIVTAANVALAEHVRAGRFRQDLMYRLAGVTLVLPPLRERGDDVLLLARFFLREAAAAEGLAPPSLPGDVARALRAYAWPGNVRELQNEMKRLVLVAAGGSLRREHLSPRMLGGEGRAASSLRDALAACERAHIRRALAQNGDNRAHTALCLGITRQGLLAKIRRLGL